MKHISLLRRSLTVALAAISLHAFSQTIPTIGTIPAGDSIIVVYDVTINSGTSSISNQGTVSGNNFTTFNTNDPKTATAGDATVTSVSPTTFYPLTTATDLSQLSQWTVLSSGAAGTVPVNFTSADQLFNISSTAANPSVAGPWSISGGSNAIITNNNGLTITPTGSLTIGSGSTFDFNNKPVTLKSSAAGTAYIGTISGTLSNATNLTVERYIGTSKRAWRLLTAPVTGTTINAAWQEGQYFDGTTQHKTSDNSSTTAPAGYGTLITLGNGSSAATTNASRYDYLSTALTPSIRTYTASAAGGDWNSTLAPTSQINNQPAYMLFVRGDRTVTSGSGTTTLRATGAYKTSGSVTVAPSGTATHTLVGNPYPSPLDFDAIYQSNNTIIQRWFWIWDATLNTNGGYKLVKYNAGAYDATPYDISGNAGSTTTGSDLRYINSGEGFLVEPNAGGVLSITESHKSITTPATQIFRTSATVQRIAVNLNLLNQDNTTTLADGVQALYGNSYTNTDNVAKASNFNENLAIAEKNNKLIVQAKPQVQSSDTIQLALWNTSERSYQFQLKGENIPSSTNAFFIDKYLNTSTPVALDGTVTAINFAVNADATSAAQDRFMVVFKQMSALPVSFTSIKAAEATGGVQVEWNVAQENNTSSYEVERSINAQSFAALGSVRAKGNSGAAESYSYLDGAPSAVNYYRIKALTTTGDIKYSSVVKVSLGSDAKGITVYPNPVSGNEISLYLHNKAAGTYAINLLNAAGQMVYSTSIKHSGGTATQTLHLPQALTSGVYNLELTDEVGERTLIKITKQ